MKRQGRTSVKNTVVELMKRPETIIVVHGASNIVGSPNYATLSCGSGGVNFDPPVTASHFFEKLYIPGEKLMGRPGYIERRIGRKA